MQRGLSVVLVTCVAETAVRYVAGLEFSFVEEPLPANALAEMRTVSEHTGAPIILDESFLRADQLAALAGDPQRWIINVRVQDGGLLRSLSLVKAARDSGISIIVGAQVGETSVLTRTGLIVARAAGGDLLAQEGAFGTHLLETNVALYPCPDDAANASAWPPVWPAFRVQVQSLLDRAGKLALAGGE